MQWTDIFIKRPVLSISISLLLFLVGLTSIRTLNVRQYPKSDSAAVVVTTAYVGASADLVRGFVTTPLERAIASADGIDYLESNSKQSVSTITVRLRLNYDVNDALTQIQAKVAQVRNDLPPEAEAPVINVESKDSQFASMYVSFYSDTLDQNQITDYLLRVVQPRLAATKGVQRADLLGGRTFAMRIWLKPDRLSALNISPTEVRQALASNNSLSTLGNTKGSMIQVNLIANTDLRSREEFEQLVIKESKGNLIRLKDVADVVLGAERYEDDVRFGGKKAVFMGIYVLPNANALDVIKEIRRDFPKLEAQLPGAIKANISYDSTLYINDSIHEVIKTLAETILIVIIVIYLFIGSLRSVLVPVVAIPLSLVGACFLMMLFGFTINLLTLLAIVLAVGIVVDDAIVMLENVERHVQLGLSPFDAAIVGARELVAPTIAMTITLAVVYAPIGLQGGLTGTLFREFAFTLAGAVLISGIVALTLSPMMSSKLLRKASEEKKLQKFLNGLFDKLRRSYRRRLEGILSYSPVTLTLSVLVMFLIVPFWMMSMKELAPIEDQGVVFGFIQAPPDASLDHTSMYANKIEETWRSFPEVDQTFMLLNANGGFAGMIVKPWSERKRTTMQIQQEAFGKFAPLAGVQLIPLVPPPLPGGSDFPVEFIITSTGEPTQLLSISRELVAKAYAAGKFMYVDADLKYDLPQTEVVLDRDKVASLGLSMQQVSVDLSALLGGDYVNRFSIDGRSYKVIPQAKRSNRLNPDQLKDLHVTGPGGQSIPLSSIATLKETVEPRQLNRFQQLNSVKIQAQPAPGVSLDQALAFFEKEAEKILPPGFNKDYAGESRQLRVEGNTLIYTLLLAGVLIYLVLASQFESFRDPFIILLGSVPLALTGALLFVFLGVKSTSINIYTQVGLITLVGLVSKNGILIVEFANSLMETGMNKREAVIEAAATRLRPVLMTTVATVVGHLPLCFVTGAGAAARNNIGVVLVTGMSIGTVFTLFVVPAIYLVIARNQRKPHNEV
ncbi:MAG: efflux RND transporter permease subunit [Verrucomicrobiota bacterium]|nr:efflux RND transporter permease subunit [Verrucomicrobiota bacterium]